MKKTIHINKKWLDWCPGCAVLTALILLACPDIAMAQGGGGSGSVLNILLLGLIAYFLVRMFRRRMGGGDKQDDSRPGKWTPTDSKDDEKGGKVIRPMDRHEVARQMWGHLSSDKQDAEPVESPQASADGAFNEAEFLEGAKLFFSRFQQAQTNRDYDALKDFLSDEVYTDAILAMQRAEKPVRTEVMLLNAKLLEVKSEGNITRVSVFFDGQLRTGARAERTEHVRTVWEFSRDDTIANGLWTLETINKVDQ